MGKTKGFSKVYDIRELGPEETRFEFSADAEERSELARRFELLDLTRLEIDGSLRLMEDERSVALSAHFVADLEQQCIVTLEPVRQHIDERFRLVYTPPVDAVPGRREVLVEINEQEPPEPLIGDAVDVGAAVAEHLSLAIDPYPRLEGATLPEEFKGAAEKGPDGTGRPFAALGKLKQRG